MVSKAKSQVRLVHIPGAKSIIARLREAKLLIEQLPIPRDKAEEALSAISEAMQFLGSQEPKAKFVEPGELTNETWRPEDHKELKR